VFAKIKGEFTRLKLIWADGAYAGQLVEWVKNACGWLLEIVRRNEGVKGFQLLPRRWVVERTFGWFGRYRRLSKDYEFQTDSSESMVLIAMIQLMNHRLTRNGQPAVPS
jgi:putative transposase